MHNDPVAGSLPEDLITPNQAACLLKVHISTVYRWCLSGRLPSYRRAGSRFLIRRADLRAVLTPVVPSAARPSEPALRGLAAWEYLRAQGMRV